MTFDDARVLRDAVDLCICEAVAEKRDSAGPANWADLSCRAVLVNMLGPDKPPTVVITGCSPDAYAFQVTIAAKMRRRGYIVIVNTEW